MPSSRPSSSSGRRPPNATHDSSNGGLGAAASGAGASSASTAKRSSSSHALNNSDMMIASTSASTSASGNSAGLGAGKRRISDNGSNGGASSSGHGHVHQVTTAHKVGPKRKSKVGIAGLVDHHGHHHGHGHHGLHGLSSTAARKKNSASSTALSRKDKSRSQLALANVANDIAAHLAAGGGNSDGIEYEQQYQRPPSRDGSGMKGKGKRTKSSLGQYQRQKSEDQVGGEDDNEDEADIEPTPNNPTGAVAATTFNKSSSSKKVAADDDNEAGWVSANSSAAVTPETGTSPLSPESYKALEFGKKNRRRQNQAQQSTDGTHAVASASGAARGGTGKVPVPPLEFPTYQQRLQRSTTEEDVLAGATPRQRESALSLGAPGRASSSNLALQAGNSAIGAAPASSSSASASASNAETPSAERLNPYQSQQQDSGPVDGAPNADKKATQHMQEQQQGQVVVTASPQELPSQSAAQEEGNLPQPVDHTARGPSTAGARPSTMRKTSTSTIRSLASMAGARAPMSTSFRRTAMTPLQPQLDTSVEGFGELKHSGLTPKQNDTPFPSNSYAYAQQQQHQAPNSAGAGAGARGGTHRRQISAHSVASSKAGTLSPKEAEELAKRLRTVSGSDLPSNADSAFGGGAQSARGALRRSASTAQGTTLASLQKYGIASPKGEHPPSGYGGNAGSGGALSTLKRASGYFGSIGRLASLGSTLGLTSLDKDAASPSPTSPLTRRAPSSGGSGYAPNQAPSPVQRLQNAYGAVRSSTKPAPQIRQPLISKFIDPSENYHPFPKASASSSAAAAAAASQGRNQSLPRGTSSRARQKLLTQRDYPEELANAAANGPPTGGSGTSDEDPTASQVNLRKNLSSKNLSGTSTPMQPGVQRWLVALSKEAERIDREHETFFRFHDTLQASFARILERKAHEEQEEARMIKEGSPVAGQSSQQQQQQQTSQQPS